MNFNGNINARRGVVKTPKLGLLEYNSRGKRKNFP